MVGPVLAGQLADRIGFARAVRLGLLAQAGAVAALVVTASPVALFVSSAIVGALVPGIVPLVLGRVHELIPDDPQRQAAAWSVTTVAFALGQAGAGYGFSFLYARTGTKTRSEEHTSELQSLAYLVCRLLLEKKKGLSTDPSPQTARGPRRPGLSPCSA